MKRVTGIGGVFFKCMDPKAMREWYRDRLGIVSDEYGGVFEWRQVKDNSKSAYTAFSTFPENSDYFDPSEKAFMINFRVENLDQLLNALAEEGVKQIGEIKEYEYGKFAWVVDPEGNKIELWEPIDSSFDHYYKGKTTHD